MFQQDTDYRDGQFYLFSAESVTFLLKPGMHRVHVRGGGLEEVFDKHVGIIPIGGPSFITTEGLEWDVTDWETKFGGQVSTSNHVLPDTEVVTVKTTGDVFFTIALKIGVIREEAGGRPDLAGGNVVRLNCKSLPRYGDRQDQ
jgi:thiamine pyrophosphokinase